MCETTEAWARLWNGAEEELLTACEVQRSVSVPASVAVTRYERWRGRRQEVKVKRTFQAAEIPCRKEGDVCGKTKTWPLFWCTCKSSVESRSWCHAGCVKEFEFHPWLQRVLCGEMTWSEKIFEGYPGSNSEDDLERAGLEARLPIRRLFY